MSETATTSSPLAYEQGPCAVPLLDTTIVGALADAVARQPNQLAVVSRHQGVRLTYRELDEASDRVARGLLALGVEAAERVGICAPNCVEWLIVQHAVGKIGAILVALNHSYREPELAHALRQSGTCVVFVPAEPQTTTGRAVLERLFPEGADESSPSPAVPTVRRVIRFPARGRQERSWNALRQAGAHVPIDDVRARAAVVRPTDVVSVLYTSGTTGDPKGAAMSHVSLLNSGFFCGERLGFTSADRLCLPLPLSHTIGGVVGWLAALTHTSTLVLPGPLFDVRRCLEAIDEERCTAFYGVPAMFAAMLGHPAFTPARLASLRTGVVAGAPVSPELLRTIASHAPQIAICYGLTEAGTLTQTLAADALDTRAETVGAVHPHVECRVVDSADGRTLERGQPGELQSRGYCTMQGYWNDRAATDAMVSPDGWLSTGDLAVMRPDGYVCIVGRVKDTIICGGWNVHPVEIENVLRRHPAIDEVAVVGVTDPIYGETPCACVKRRADAALSTADVLRLAREYLVSYKVPRRVLFLDEFPLTGSGKIRRSELRHVAAAALAESGAPKAHALEDPGPAAAVREG